jgi:tetratricopeptide (TPR) repeat protein
VQALINLGALHSGREQPDKAEDCFRRALAVDPTSARIRLRLARELRQQSRLDEARRIYDELLAADPALVEAHLGLARVARVAGRFEEERRHLRRALELDPDEAAALSGLAEAGDPAIGEPELARMLALAEDSGKTPRERRRLHFALAACAERDSAFDRAFRHFEQANALRRTELAASGHAYDADDDAARVDRLIGVFGRDLLAPGKDMGDPSELPVFIVGMPRSGTTLCEQILASHPAVHGAGERGDLLHLANGLADEIAAATGAAPRAYPTCAADLPAEVARRLAGEHLERLRALAPHARRITDKTPTNFRQLGLIALLFPKARIIHCRRDPLDTCWSCYAEDFNRSYAWAWDFDSLAAYHRLYRRLMAHWREVLPNSILELDYEALVADPEGESRRMIAFCGLDWDERCLRFHETERPVHTASIAQVRRPIYTGSVGRWRRYEPHLASLREALERQP